MNNVNQETTSTDIPNQNINDCLYYQIFIKNKKNQKINMKKHFDFIEKNNTLTTNNKINLSTNI